MGCMDFGSSDCGVHGAALEQTLFPSAWVGSKSLPSTQNHLSPQERLSVNRNPATPDDIKKGTGLVLQKLRVHGFKFHEGLGFRVCHLEKPGKKEFL